ncbi:MAG: glycoside hydrolase family 26 protein [Prevotella sp.]|nr:glycoside hydrolase family 26 protein [Prevotella sp.]
MKKIILSLAMAAAIVSCNSSKTVDDPLAESGRTQRTENLLANLRKISANGYLIGHQDDPGYGVGWVGDSCRSDVKSVCNDYPALIGFDLGHLELGDSVNLDGVPFNRMREEIIRQYDRGGMVTLSWHLDNPLTGGSAWVKPDSLTDQEKQTVASVLEGGECHEKFLGWLDTLASFLNSLETPYGVKVPVLFRPWHEHTGSWFWWGQNLCTTDQYKALWKLTEDRLKEKGVNNVLYAYSPGTEFAGDADKYLERWPGDGMVDVIGFDTYCTNNPEDTTAINNYRNGLDLGLKTICEIAKQHNVVPALSETGMESLGMENWWTEVLMPVLNKYPIAYVLLWRNAHDKPGHFYMPYPGQKTVSDFVKFYNDKRTLFVKDINGLYLQVN